ncbi:MAG: hypothetical protein KDK48_03350 [Chlamydiia bacterium]|nr:hypothetical protein [Chlamydiia bacterium]
MIALASNPASSIFIQKFFKDAVKADYIPKNTPKSLRNEALATRVVLEVALGRNENDILTENLLNLRSPIARKRALQLIARYSGELKKEILDKPAAIAIALMRCPLGVDIVVAAGPKEGNTLRISPRQLKNEKLQQQMLITCFDLLNTKGIKNKRISELLSRSLQYSGSEKIIHELQKISAVITLDRVDLLLKDTDLDKSLQTAFEDAVGVEGVENFSHKFLETIGKFRSPQALYTYVAKLQELPEPDRTNVLSDVHTYIVEVLNNEFQKNRAKGLDDRWTSGSRKRVSVYPLGILFDFTQLLRTKFGDGHISKEVAAAVTPYLDDTSKKPPEDLKSFEKELILLAREGMHHLEPLLRALETEYAGVEKEIENDVRGWIQEASAVKGGVREYTLIDSDDPCDFLLMGTEVSGSCQEVNGDPDLNKGLVGTMLDGHNRLLMLKSPSGKIVGRALLRLVEENGKPALLLERVYPETLGSAESEVLIGFAKERSEALGWPLYGVKFEGEPTSVLLISKGGRGSYQYVDSAGGIQPNGAFQIVKPKLLNGS